MMTPSAYPLVSIIMPVKDCGEYLEAAVSSLISQDYPNIEIIIIDDGTQDNSLNDIPNLNNIRLIKNHGQGIVSALNTGIAMARGEYIARMDGDDVALSHRISTQINYLMENPEIGIAGAQVEIIHSSEVGAGYLRYKDWINALLTPDAIQHAIFVESPVPHPTAIFRRDVFKAIGHYHETVWPEDYDLWLRAYQAGIRIGKPEGILFQWRDHSGRLSRVDNRYTNKQFIQAKACYLSQTLLRQRKVAIWGTGPNGITLFDALKEYGVFVDVFIDIHPRRIGGQKRGRHVLSHEHISALKGHIILIAVASLGARPEIHKFLYEQNMQEGHDYIFTA